MSLGVYIYIYDLSEIYFRDRSENFKNEVYDFERSKTEIKINDTIKNNYEYNFFIMMY